MISWYNPLVLATTKQKGDLRMDKQVGSQEMIRQLNRQLILNLVRKSEPVSRAQIAKELQLSRSTVSQIVDGLLQDELIFEAEREDTTGKSGGRPGQMLRYNAVSSWLVAMDLTQEKSAACISDLRGSILLKEEFGPAAGADDVHSFIQQLTEHAGIPSGRLRGISISVPGSVNRAGKVLRCSQLNWRNYDLRSELSAWHDAPIAINNDVNLALIGEQRFGKGRNCGNLVYLHLGKGIGCGILCSGNLVDGHSFMAGEIGTMRIVPEDGSPVLTLEQAIGLSFFGSQEGFRSSVAGYTRGRDPDKIKIQSFIRSVSTTIVMITSLLNPHRLILGGIMSEAMADILEDVRESVAAGTTVPIDIQLASLGEQACLMGALAFELNRLDQEA